MSRSNVYFDVSMQGQHLGRIVFKLYDDIVPKTARNFRELATGVHGFSYVGSVFHRIIPEMMIQGGDITHHNGTGGKSIYGGRFADESFAMQHTRPGRLAMANAGPNSNLSQFYITTVAAPWLDGKNVVFGEVVEGMDVVTMIEKRGSGSGRPSKSIAITGSGIVGA